MKAYLLALALAGVSSAALADPDKAGGLPIVKHTLNVQSEPSGALAKAAYGPDSDIKTVECLTPCALQIPKGVRFAMIVSKDGFNTAAPALAWKNGGLGGFVVKPNPVVVKLEPVAGQ